MPPNGNTDPADPQADILPWPNTDGNGNAVISLTAGQRYSFELWHVEGDSGRAEVTFKYAGAADPANGSASVIVSSLIGAFVDPTGLPPTITTQPANVNFASGGTVDFSVVASSSVPLTYQWYQNQAVVSGATASTLSITNAGLATIGSYYVVVANVNGSVTSQPAAALPTTAVTPPHKTFQQDNAGLTVIETEHYYGATPGTDGHVWVPVTGRAGYSGSGYMAVLPDSGVNYASDMSRITNGARLDFQVNFTASGTNYLWLRGGDPFGAGAGDSVHAGIDGTVSVVQITGAPTFNIATGWNWVGKINGDTPAFVVVPSTGTHTVSLWMREDGFQVDKLILTTDPAFAPTDAGPPESQEVTTSRPIVSITRNASNAPVITYTGTLESAATVNGPYSTVADASGGTYTPNVQQGAQQFFRAKQ